MKDQETLARFAEEAGFASLAFRDVPLRDPSFGDVGQVFDVWTYLGYMTALDEIFGHCDGRTCPIMSSS